MAKQLNFPANALEQLADMARHLAAVSSLPRSLALASAVHGEGASSAAAALAVSLVRQHRLRVLLVDANLRYPSQHLLFALPQSPGLSELLRDGGDWAAAVCASGEEGLGVITAGAEIDNPDRYFEIGMLKERIARLGAAVDWVIVDCAPVNAYPDAPLIAAACTASVLVLRSGRTRREIVLEAKRRLTQTGANLAGVVLNRRRYYIPKALYRWL